MFVSRRELFRLAGLGVASLFLPREDLPPTPTWPRNLPTPDPSKGEPQEFTTLDGRVITETGLILDDRTAIALAAAEAAVRSMPGKYSWEEYRTCSTFISTYLGELGLSISDKTEKAAASSGLFPWSGTLRQVNWLKQNLPRGYVHNANLIYLLDGRLWKRIRPGEVIYFDKAVGHNGYNVPYHVAALVGYHEDGQPQFAELAAGMKNASAERTFEQLTKFYKRKADGSWDVTPYNSTIPLKVTWFDPLAVIRDFT